MDTLYQALVAVNPTTLIAQIGNLFIQLYFFRRFFLDKVLGILDQRRAMADREIAEAETAKTEAVTLRAHLEEDLRRTEARTEALMASARQDASARSEKIITQAKQQAAQLHARTAAELEQQRQAILRDARDEIGRLSIAAAEKILGRTVNADDQQRLVGQFLDQLGDAL